MKSEGREEVLEVNEEVSNYPVSWRLSGPFGRKDTISHSNFRNWDAELALVVQKQGKRTVGAYKSTVRLRVVATAYSQLARC